MLRHTAIVPKLGISKIYEAENVSKIEIRKQENVGLKDPTKCKVYIYFNVDGKRPKKQHHSLAAMIGKIQKFRKSIPHGKDRDFISGLSNCLSVGYISETHLTRAIHIMDCYGVCIEPPKEFSVEHHLLQLDEIASR